MAAIDGTQAATMDALDRLQLPPDAEVLGPVPVEDTDRPGADLDDGGTDGSGDLLLGLDPGLPAGTRLRMEQVGFKPDQEQAYRGAIAGWPRFFDGLEQTLARLD